MKAAIVRRRRRQGVRHLSDPPEVLLPVFRAEAEVFVQAVPHIIAVEYEVFISSETVCALALWQWLTFLRRKGL